MNKIAVVTATRAEYGLLSPVIKKLRSLESESFKVNLIVTGTHLSEQYGMTVCEIDDRIDHKIPISVSSASGADISANQAEALVKSTDLFLAEKYNGIVLLGDRYEMLAVAIAAGNTHTPIFHLCGGDTTEGALDEWIRHSITKMSYLHFVTNEDSRRRVIQLGENPNRVFNYGSTSIDNVLHVADMTKTEVLESIGLADCKYALCTYHPVTMENGSVDNQIKAFLAAIEVLPELQFIVTKSNADQGGARINELLDEAEKEIDNLHVYTSLGVRRYLSLMKYAEFVLGNSSSGIIETPAFHVPTVNIGDRQRGRLQSESIIDCGEDTVSIVMAIKKAMTAEFRAICNSVVSPYGDGHAAEKITKKISEAIASDRIDLKKKFFDIEANL
ncbi:GDP/UDP-N,N'-diacetylbacillosamine 2-epimerase (hydrolysing) [Anaerovibrio lipolyticus DSM 3074]|uniref:GDP/UDP-N,N'-diacetylbacillosamine 2-epimerase (Hydrolysing) n=1 Tax=Anaerovibrio lipolyticus DSM 3074 TaxID=1120997 RepID=A0A1M6FES9_9FIRM|nr:UDP-N-acetylglucosamine 2-epimerase [Anaerovibrio lipolyticus]SHI96177.1 GDP/UDP-N,N'-diacetylbacillosamine 2-epimerase (hydrolysing) [Anaerovibrio lipolyticus DSM 3074]